MDREMQRQGWVSCRYSRWLFDVARRRRVPEKHLLNHVATQRRLLDEPNEFIPWDEFALICANLGSWLTDQELIEEGRQAWSHADFAPWLQQASLFAAPANQLLTILQPGRGIVAGLPIDVSTTGGDDQIEVRFEMQDELAPSRAFFRTLAGQLAALPARFGNESAEVDVEDMDAGARLSFWLPHTSVMATTRHRLSGPLRAAAMARELDYLMTQLSDRERRIADEIDQHRQLSSQLAEREQKLARVQAENERLSAAHRDLDVRIRRLNAQTQDLLEATTEAVVKTDAWGRITWFNTSTAEIFGYSAEFLEGALLTTLIPGAGSRQIGRFESMDGIDRRSNGLQLEVLAIAAGNTEDGHLWVIRDLTRLDQADKERAALQQQLQAAQRVEALGELTGGIAHDFNNLLLAINGYADLALETPNLQDPLTEYLGEIRNAGNRAADMTQKLLTFARQQDLETAEVDLNELTRGVEKILERLLPVTIKVRFLRSLQSPLVLADPGQLEQVLVNLCVNARDAMPDGGQLTIAVGQQDSQNPDGSWSEVATLTVEDTGTGIPPEIAKRIFEPFFTTKAKGEGTGLGLSVVFGIIKQHLGTIDVDSTPGRGTRFQISLPMMQRDQRLERPKFETSSAATPGTRGNETILLIEDNEQVRQLMERVLTQRGYRVLLAADGIEGLHLFEQRAAEIHLVIADVVMPRMGGEALFSSIRALQPRTRLLFSTGYSLESRQAKFIEDHGLDVIHKPYTPEALCERVRRSLGTV